MSFLTKNIQVYTSKCKVFKLRILSRDGAMVDKLIFPQFLCVRKSEN